MERKVFSIANVSADWKQGKKRKLALICLALLVLLIGKCCLNGKTEYEAIRFGLDDFAKERDAESLFYVKEGEDDGLKPVVPNLMRMPKILKPDISLCESLSGDELKYRHKGWAYYNNPELTVGVCKVARAGEGWAIVKPESEFMYGRCFGYINTDDEYLNGDDLKAGFYYLIGKKKAKVGAGSALTINEYVMVPEPGLSCALAAVEYNLKAKRAAQEENALRNRKREILENLPAIVDDLHIKEFKNKVHLPAELEGRAEVKLQSKEIEIKLPVGFNSHKFAIEDLKRRAAQKDLSYFLGMALQIQSDGSDIVGGILMRLKCQLRVQIYHRRINAVSCILKKIGDLT